MFEVVGFLSLYSLFLILFFALFRMTGLSLLYPSIPMVLYWSYLVCAYLGIPLLFFRLIPRYSDVGISDKSIIWAMLIYSAICLCLLLLGCLYAKNILNLKPNFVKQSKTMYDAHVSTFTPILLMSLSLTVFFLYTSKLDKLPIIGLLEGLPSYAVGRLRIDVTRFFQGKYHWYSLWFASILPFVSYYFFAIYVETKKKWLLLWFLISFLFSSFALLCNLEKQPFLLYIGGLIFVYLLSKDKKISKKMLLFTLMFLSLFLFTVWIFFMGVSINHSPFYVLSLAFQRIFTGQLVPLYMYFYLVPNHIDYLLGQTFPNPMEIFPWIPFDFTHEAMVHFNYYFLGKETYGGNMPTVFWGEIYVNFGTIIAFLSAFCIGILLYTIHFFITNGYKTPLRIALISWMAIHFHKLAITGAGFLLFDIYLWGVLLSAFLIKMLQWVHLKNGVCALSAGGAKKAGDS